MTTTAAPKPTARTPTTRTLRRPADGRLIAGVAGGVADAVGMDVTIVRIVLVVLAVTGGLGVPLYLAAWLLMPDERHGASVADRVLGEAGPLAPWGHAPWPTATTMASAPAPGPSGPAAGGAPVAPPAAPPGTAA